jgi:CDP-diacylglycerol--glycerol-3-phosphate 3-phosphatidyltransferase
MKHLPFWLIYSRIVIAIVIGLAVIINIPHLPVWIVTLMTLGLLTDVLDGVIARRIGVATKKLRVWDSNVDQFFWIVIIACVFYLNSPFIKVNYLPVLIIVVLEATAYLISFLKFRRTVATHTYMAKLWTHTLLAFLVDLTLHSQSNLLFKICAFLGIVSRLEIILIIARLKEWTVDVPSQWSFKLPK